MNRRPGRRPASRRARTHALLSGGAALTAAVVLTGCGTGSGAATTAPDKPRLKISGAFMPEPVTSAMAAGFFTVTNSGGADTLTSVTSDLADQVTLHTTEGGAMREQDAFAVPANGTLDFARGGNHLMFERLAYKPKAGQKVSVELHFKTTGTVAVELAVKPATYNPDAGGT